VTLTRLNPLTGLGLLAVIGLVVSFVLEPLPVLLLHLALLGLLLVAGTALSMILRNHLVFAPFALGVLMVNAISRPGEPVAVVGPLEATDDGVRIGLALALRVLVVAVPAVALARASDPTRLVIAAIDHLRVPHTAGFALLTAHRMLAAMPQEWQTLLDAGRVRAPLDRRGRPRLGVTGHVRAAFALLVGSIRRGDRIADALEVRGVRTRERTRRLAVPFRRLDAAAVVTVLVLGTAALVAGTALAR
jgi:energy-coupling factor transport system permease protein